MKKSPTVSDQNFDDWIAMRMLIRQTRDAINRIREDELSPHGISPSQAVVLLVINSIGKKATPAEISRWLFRQPHSVAGILNRMERNGLIRKTKDLDRKNMIRIGMTKKGQRAYRDSFKRESSSKVINCLSQKERQQLKSLLEKLRNRAFEELGVKDKPRLL